MWSRRWSGIKNKTEWKRKAVEKDKVEEINTRKIAERGEGGKRKGKNMWSRRWIRDKNEVEVESSGRG